MLIAGAALLIIIALVMLIFAMDSSAGYEALYTDLTDKDAAAIIEKLEEDKISYKLKLIMAPTILVPAGQKYKTRINLASQNLPHGDAGLELFFRKQF